MFGAANMKTMLEQADTLNTKTCFGKAFSQKLQGFSSFRVVSTFFYYSCCFFGNPWEATKSNKRPCPNRFFFPKKGVAGGDGSRVQGTTAPSMADRPVEAMR